MHSWLHHFTRDPAGFHLRDPSLTDGVPWQSARRSAPPRWRSSRRSGGGTWRSRAALGGCGDGWRLTTSRSRSPSPSRIRRTGPCGQPATAGRNCWCAALMRIVAVITDPGAHHPHPHAPGPERRTRPPIPEPAAEPTPARRPHRRRATSVERSPSSPLPTPDPGPLGAPAAHRQALPARFSTQPQPVPAPNTPDPRGSRPHPPTRDLLDAPTPRPDTRTGTKEVPIYTAGIPGRGRRATQSPCSPGFVLSSI